MKFSMLFSRFFLKLWLFLLYLATDIDKKGISFSSTLIFIKRSKTWFSRWDNTVLGIFIELEEKVLKLTSLLFFLYQIYVLWLHDYLQWWTNTVLVKNLWESNRLKHVMCTYCEKPWIVSKWNISMLFQCYS